MLTVLNDQVQSLANRRHGSGPRGPRGAGVLALPGAPAVLRGDLAGLRERNIGVWTKPEIPTATEKREPNDPAPGAGRAHVEIKAAAIGVATQPRLLADEIGETEEPATDANASPNTGGTGG